MRDKKETAAASSVTRVNDGRETASAANGATENGASASDATEASTEEGAASAREWIETWRERQKVAVSGK